MGKLKNHLIGIEEMFWAEANNVIGCCETLPEFCNTMWEYRDNLPINTDYEVMEMLKDAWQEKWSDYQ